MDHMGMPMVIVGSGSFILSSVCYADITNAALNCITPTRREPACLPVHKNVLRRVHHPTTPPPPMQHCWRPFTHFTRAARTSHRCTFRIIAMPPKQAKLGYVMNQHTLGSVSSLCYAVQLC